MATARKVTMSNRRLAHVIDRKSGGNLHGDQTLRLDGINWRVHGVEYDPKANTWRIDAKVCESNPNARPKVDASGITAEDTSHDTAASGCKCTCGSKCYHWNANEKYPANTYYFSASYASACF
ncbi:MAG: hypothetical protein ACR2J8_13330 [Thermomicrobiales bacterium]